MADSRKEFRDLAENAEFSYSHPGVLWLPNFTMISKWWQRKLNCYEDNSSSWV